MDVFAGKYDATCVSLLLTENQGKLAGLFDLCFTAIGVYHTNSFISIAHKKKLTHLQFCVQFKK